MSDDALTAALIAAASDPGAYGQFVSALMGAEIFVIGHHDEGGLVDGTLVVGTKVHIEAWEDKNGEPFTPFFATLEALQEEVLEPTEYLKFSARWFLKLTLGHRLILYAVGGYGKEFLPGEVARLLSD